MGFGERRHQEGRGYDLWMTPPEMIEDLESEFGEMFDPCPAGRTMATPDGLEIDWPVDTWCFVNPPYTQIAEWTAKCRKESERGVNIVLLIPARTDTRYFWQNVIDSAEVRFIKGRIRFHHPDGRKPQSAPFPSILCIYGGGE